MRSRMFGVAGGRAEIAAVFLIAERVRPVWLLQLDAHCSQVDVEVRLVKIEQTLR